MIKSFSFSLHFWAEIPFSFPFGPAPIGPVPLISFSSFSRARILSFLLAAQPAACPSPISLPLPRQDDPARLPAQLIGPLLLAWPMSSASLLFFPFRNGPRPFPLLFPAQLTSPAARPASPSASPARQRLASAQQRHPPSPRLASPVSPTRGTRLSSSSSDAHTAAVPRPYSPVDAAVAVTPPPPTYCLHRLPSPIKRAAPLQSLPFGSLFPLPHLSRISGKLGFRRTRAPSLPASSCPAVPSVSLAALLSLFCPLSFPLFPCAHELPSSTVAISAAFAAASPACPSAASRETLAKLPSALSPSWTSSRRKWTT